MLRTVVERRLSFEEAKDLFEFLLEESPVRVAAALAAMEARKYSSEELAGLAAAMREKAVTLELGEVADTCGTGGDNASTINVSTAAAIVLSLFTRVAKHGNLAVTSKSGSANLLEELGINYRLNAEAARALVELTNFTFIFAPLYHPALAKLMPVRRELGIRTIFNFLGPLTNPAKPKRQLVGVSSGEAAEKVAEALQILGVEKGFVVHGDGLDEVNTSGATDVFVVEDGIEKLRLFPEDFGLRASKIVPCSSARESAARILAVFEGRGLEEDRNFVIANAALALHLFNEDLRECVELISERLSCAARKVREIACASNSIQLNP
ncbi:MAG: anthranilate phosphoribosyltransferase [Archaeoglobaceae archaeon]